MKLPALSAVLLGSVFMSACTTVDLSQVAVQNQPVQEVETKQNVVERASVTLTSTFKKNGWCSISPQEKTQTATSILLNGVQTDTNAPKSNKITLGSEAQLASDLVLANQHIVQTTKAAEVFLSMSDGGEDLDSELSLLETALLSSKEAQVRFEQAGKSYDTDLIRTNLQTLQNSVTALKNVTDEYGERARANIAIKAIASRS